MRASGGSDASRRPRRSWPTAEKREVIAENFAPGASVAQVAQRYGLDANLLFTWRRRFQRTLPASLDAARLVPVSISVEPSRPGRCVGIVLAGGERIYFGACADAGALPRLV